MDPEIKDKGETDYPVSKKNNLKTSKPKKRKTKKLKPDYSKYKLIVNQNPKRILITGKKNHQLILPSLGSKNIEYKNLKEFNIEPYLERDYITVEIGEDPDKTKNLTNWISLILAGYIIISFIFYILLSKTPWYWIISIPILLTIIGCVSFSILKGWEWFQRASMQVLSLFIVLLIGVGLPAAVIYYFCGGEELIANQTPKLLETTLESAHLSLTQLGHLLQFIFIVIVSLLPALLFYLYDRERLGTLREDFLRQIFRFDPNMKTMTDVEAKYGSKIEELYGSEAHRTKARLLGGSRIPILLATLVITLAWLLVLLPAGMDKAITDPNELHVFFIPQAESYVFAFLGAYFFTLGMLLRRYARGDLRPKAYTHVAVRVIIVLILAWVLDLFIWENKNHLLILAFFIGIFPEQGLTFIKESFQFKRGWITKVFPSLSERHPLTNLGGIDFYDRARLQEEGVTNVESLAHHDIIDLMLDTRIPIPRLVDWVDQAILYIHVVPDIKEIPKKEKEKSKNNKNKSKEDKEKSKNNKNKSKEDKEKSKNEDFEENLLILQQYGIRNATDLLFSALAAKNRNENGASKQDEFKIFLGILDGHDISRQPQKLRIILDAILDDEWLDHIWYWRQSYDLEGKVFTIRSKKKFSKSKKKNNELITKSFSAIANKLYDTKKSIKGIKFNEIEL
jgi:hypothetical protein